MNMNNTYQWGHGAKGEERRGEGKEREGERRRISLP
jgi:hypothetical protein